MFTIERLSINGQQLIRSIKLATKQRKWAEHINEFVTHYWVEIRYS